MRLLCVCLWLLALFAGLGRAPATALAYMFWVRGWQLPAAFDELKSVRACSPRIEAIRAATADLLTDGKPLDVTISMRRRGAARSVQVAGLDVGWHTLLDLQENPVTHRLEVTRQLLPGSYPFKFIMDGTWCPNHDYPTYQVCTVAWVRVLLANSSRVPCGSGARCLQLHQLMCFIN